MHRATPFGAGEITGLMPEGEPGYVCRAMSSELAALLRDQHAELRALLADLTRQPAITETITGPQLRARRRLMRTIQHTFLAQTASRLRHLWPAIRAAGPDGRACVREAWDRARVIEYRMAKRDWYGERDEAITDLEDHIASDLETHVTIEERLLRRLDTDVDETTLAGRMREGGPWPTRPHPDAPRSPRLAALMVRPLAVADRVADRLGRSME